MNIEVKADIKPIRQISNKDKFFMIKTQIFNKKNKLKAEAEIGYINEVLDLDKFRKELKNLLDVNYRLKILSHVEFNKKEEYDIYKSKL